MVFILYKLYVLLPYTYPTPKLSPHRRRCISTFHQKTHTVWFISVLNYGDPENILINHLLLVIPMSYPCHYKWHTNLCPHKPHKHAHTHTHTHTLSCLVGDTSFPEISPTWLHRYYLNWTELDDGITQFNNELPLTQKCSYFDTVQQLLNCIESTLNMDLLWSCFKPQI